MDRELSWLKFNQRVLEEAEDLETPILEKMQFLSIFMNNLDEFYRVRVGILSDKMLVDESFEKKIKKQLKNILQETGILILRYNLAYSKIIHELAEYGLCHISYQDSISLKEKEALCKIFEHQVAPLVSPYIIGKKYPFPFFESGGLIVGALLKTRNGNTRYGLIPVPTNMERVIFSPIKSHSCIEGLPPVSDELKSRKFILIEELILMFADKIFHKFDVQEKIIFSIIRNADINENEGVYDYDADLKDTMSKIIKRRRISTPVKIKYSGDKSLELISYLKRVLYLSKKQVFRYNTPLNLNFLPILKKELDEKTRANLSFAPYTPIKNPDIDENNDLIAQITQKDILLSYPFEDISTMILLLEQCAKDERVKSIYMTLYRVAKNSKIISTLIDAKKNGKNVTCVIELRARFDEENNIDWAERLEQAGCRVFYGFPGHKIHAKLLLVETETGQDVCLIGTGNFNEATAQVYTDLSLLTANTEIILDVKNVFHSIFSETFVKSAKHLLVAPLFMKKSLIDLIDQEIENKKQGKPAEIIIKINSLTEKEMIDKLVEASCAGVKIKMIVRGICCVIPGVPGKTDNITVRSIVGRFLEHSRIFVFGAGNKYKRKYYISSADLMTRNMSGRVEVAVPIYDKECQAKIMRILTLNFYDNVKARILKPTGIYEKYPAYRRRKIKDSQYDLMGNPD